MQMTLLVMTQSVPQSFSQIPSISPASSLLFIPPRSPDHAGLSPGPPQGSPNCPAPPTRRWPTPAVVFSRRGWAGGRRQLPSQPSALALHVPRSTPRCSHPVSSTYCASFCLLLGHRALSLHFSTGTFQGLWEEVLHLLTKSEPGFVGSFSVFSLVVSQLHCTWYSCNFMFICRLWSCKLTKL